MSLHIQHLTKWYGSQRAVHDISFQVSEGGIVGFLGPNGAGKSTTLKIATGYLPPTEGTVHVNGINVAADPLHVKRITGYLPEHNPLYPDLFVPEYLHFVGRLYGLKGQKLNARVDEMVDLCGLAGEQHKKIEALSKGYRQRVGLAQALLHDPQVLILDEPTSGLDPNQIMEIRRLIKAVSKNKTVLFSTHIMQEVQALCDRVIVIHKGEIVADDLLSHLLSPKGASVAVIAEFGSPVETGLLLQVKGISKIEHLGQGIYRIEAEPTVDIRPVIFRFAADQNLSLLGLKQEENSLEAVFRELTSNPS